MHPILIRGERLAAYLAVWLIIGILLATVLTGQGLDWPEALALMLPLCLVYSFVCLSGWYVCRATPLRTSSLARVLATSGLAALFSGALWLGLARAWVAILTEIPIFVGSAAAFLDQMPFLLAAGVLLFLLALAVHHALVAFEAALEAERRQLELEVFAREAELRALRAQVDPHFLYNSLNSISALTQSDPAGARRMCILLAEFLRETLRVSARARIPLSEELGLAERFLGIEQVRFGKRLRIEQHVDATAAACRVPPLVLQPLVENAITHGIAGLLEGGVIHLDITRTNGRLAVALENPRDSESLPAPGRGVGLDNVRRRLTTMFGSGATVRARAEADRFRVELDLPCSFDD